jgi:hypothetical protein
MAKIEDITDHKDYLFVKYSGVHENINELPDQIAKIEEKRRQYKLKNVIVELTGMSGDFTPEESNTLFKMLKLWSDIKIAFLFKPDNRFFEIPKDARSYIRVFHDIEGAEKWVNE